VVAGNNLSVRRGNALAVGVRAALSRVHGTLLLRLRGGAVVGSGAVVHTLRVLGLWWLAVRAMGRLDVNVCDSAAFAIVGDGLILVGGLGELGDDVPSMEKAGDEAEEAEKNVDERVGAADATLDPDYKQRLVQVSQQQKFFQIEAEAWGDIPGSGGKRMARMPRKMSVEHIVAKGEIGLKVKMAGGDGSLEVAQVKNRNSRIVRAKDAESINKYKH
jgi:hypothetical protein